MVKKKSKVDIVYDGLIQDIAKGDYKPGDRMVISSISKIYEVSDIPVREAIRNLESKGYVTVIPDRGVVVNSFDKESIAAIIEIKAVLEGFAALQSIDYITPTELTKLRQMNEQMRDAHETGNYKKFSRLNMNFHLEIYNSVPVKELYNTICGLWEKWDIIRAVFDMVPERTQQSISEHDKIIDMLESKNREKIEMFMRNHKLRSRNDLIGHLPDSHAAAIGITSENDIKGGRIL